MNAESRTFSTFRIASAVVMAFLSLFFAAGAFAQEAEQAPAPDSSSAPAPAVSAPAPDLEATITKFALKRYNGPPFIEARQFNGDALPILANLLNDPVNEPYYATIVETIGLIGDEKGIDILDSFLMDNRFKGEVNGDESMALYLVPAFIGHIAAHGSQRALAYLVDGTKEQTWISKGITWRYRQQMGSKEETESSITGLGIAVETIT